MISNILNYFTSLNSAGQALFIIGVLLVATIGVTFAYFASSSQNDNAGINAETEELGIYKSFNYEIFERRKSVVIAFDGNSPVSNLVQEAKNGKGKSKIYVNQENHLLKEKADSLEGYVIPFEMKDNIVKKILEDNPELKQG